MNWISNYVRPKLKAILRSSRENKQESLWSNCPSCGVMINNRTLDRLLYVCPDCDHHMSLPPRKRFEHMFDNASYKLIDVEMPTEDPLGFKDTKRYVDRILETRKRTGEQEAMLVAEGEVGKTPMVIAAQDFSFMAGSMGVYVGNAVAKASKHCIKTKQPLVIFAAAGGARMQEGILSLMQLPRTTLAVRNIKEASLPYIVVLTHPTTGGVTASYAMLGDIHIAEPKALVGFAGPRVIEQTIKEKLPEGFQRSEYLLEHGMLDMVVHRAKVRDRIITIVRMLMQMEPSIKGALTYDENGRKPNSFKQDDSVKASQAGNSARPKPG